MILTKLAPVNLSGEGKFEKKERKRIRKLIKKTKHKQTARHKNFMLNTTVNSPPWRHKDLNIVLQINFYNIKPTLFLITLKSQCGY